MRLYDYKPAPSPRRVRIFLAEKGIEVPTTQVDLAAGAQFEAEFSRINPLHTVPALELDDGTMICESMAICRHFEALQPDPPLFGGTAREQGLVEMWIRTIEYHGLMAVADILRNTSRHFADRGLTGAATGIPQIPALAERGRASLTRFFPLLESQLGQQAFLAGESYTVADITALVTVDFARWVKIEPPAECARLAAWYQRVSARPSSEA
jgi:glutathione S-transferase